MEEIIEESEEIEIIKITTSEKKKRYSSNSKPMKILGRDDEKTKSKLGISDDEIDVINQQNMERIEELYKRKKYVKKIKDKKGTKKAQEMLGIEVSKDKIMDRLGIDEPAFEEIISELQENNEQKIANKRKNVVQTNKRHTKKALTILGTNPSNEKAKKTLGIGDEELVEAEIEIIAKYEESLERKRQFSVILRKQARKALRILGFRSIKKQNYETFRNF